MTALFASVGQSVDYIERLKSLPKNAQVRVFNQAVAAESDPNATHLLQELVNSVDLDSDVQHMNRALWETAFSDNTGAFQILSALPNVDMNETQDALTPLMAAAQESNGQIVKTALQRKDTDPNRVLYTGVYVPDIEDTVKAIPQTALTIAFGHVAYDAIPVPSEQSWQHALYYDPRVNWETHNAIVQETLDKPLGEKIISAIPKQAADARALREEEAIITQALGL